MEGTDITETRSSSHFMKHLFSFDGEYKSDVLNVIQYALLAIIPVVILNKAMQKFVPEADEEKGSFELLAEIVIQVIVMFLGLIFIDRIIIYIPPYSGTKYKEFSILYTVLAILMITMSLQTKLGEKISLLYERVSELWEGKKDDKDSKGGKKKKSGNVKVKQPIAQNNSMAQSAFNQSMMTQAMYTDGTSLSSLPTSDATLNSIIPQISAPVQQQPQTNSGSDMNGYAMEPMAANAVLGSGAFSNW